MCILVYLHIYNIMTLVVSGRQGFRYTIMVELGGEAKVCVGNTTKIQGANTSNYLYILFWV
jgi:hypothetical protein